MSKFKDYFAPTVVLVLICLVVTAALSITYGITTPIIDANAAKAASAARAELLPAGAENGFDKVEKGLGSDIVEAYVAKNGSGYVVTSVDKGFGGDITVMTGVDKDGKITGVKVLNHAETPGLGTKAMTVEYLSQYVSQPKITVSDEPDKTSINTITGATISSKAIFRAVEKALLQAQELGGVIND